MFVEYCTAINVLLVRFSHRSRTRLRCKDAIVAVGLQLRQKEAIELFCFHLLHTYTESQNLTLHRIAQHTGSYTALTHTTQ